MESRRIPAGCIVVGVDAVRATDRALDWAADQAALEDRNLHLVHGTGARLALGSASSIPGTPDPLEQSSQLEATGHGILARATTRALARHPELVVHRTLRLAEPSRLLLDLSTDAALVVVGSRGRGLVLRMALGSVSEEVARHAACPVVVLRPRGSDAPHAGVLVAVTGGREALAPLRFGIAQATRRRQPLTLLSLGDPHVVDATPPHVVPASEPGLAAERLALVDALAAARAADTDVDVRLLVGRGNPAECVLALAGQMDLVVVGHHDRHGVGRLGHRSTSLDVLENAPSTVAVVPLDAGAPMGAGS
jgi:nucleotide-binding universal stress UspA family protein